MSDLLYLVHRLPYPPNKGDKVRSYHLLKHLSASHRVYLGTFVDDPEDEIHIKTVRTLCADLFVARLKPRFARVRSLAGLLRNEPLTLEYYRDAQLQSWVDAVCAKKPVETAVIFSSAMTQYVSDKPALATLVDFVDVDSAKWSGYALKRRWPVSWLYKREGRELLAYEREVARHARRSFFVTEKEADLFRAAAPESAERVSAMQNGVDSDYFSPDIQLTSPYADQSEVITFTGAMDYWPNVDAVSWFAKDIFPILRTHRPGLQFYIVGRAPTPAVRALASDDVYVTGTVPDVRPYLSHAAVVVAPLRLARGIQNKILEAMAMGRPVVASTECGGAIEAIAGRDFEIASTVTEFVTRILSLLSAPSGAKAMGEAARLQVLGHYSWEAHLAQLDQYLVSPQNAYVRSKEILA